MDNFFHTCHINFGNELPTQRRIAGWLILTCHSCHSLHGVVAYVINRVPRGQVTYSSLLYVRLILLYLQNHSGYLQCVRCHPGEAMVLLIFILGTLLGILAGGALCIRYLRREIAADIGPQLRQIQGQLDYMEAMLTYALQNRYAELSAGPTRPPVLPPPRATGD